MIRFVIRWTLRFLALAACVVGVALVARDFLLREWVEFRLAAVTGLPTKLDGLATSLRDKSVTLTGLRLQNAPEFGDGPLAVIPTLQLSLDDEALGRREWRLRLARVHIAEIHVVRNQSGKTNVVELSRAVQERASVIDAVLVAPPGFEFTGIETLDLTLDKLRLADLSLPGLSKDIELGVKNEILHNVDEFADLSPLFVRLALEQIGKAFRPRSAPGH